MLYFFFKVIKIQLFISVLPTCFLEWPRICSDYHKQCPVLFTFMTYRRVCNLSKTTGATNEAETAYPFGA